MCMWAGTRPHDGLRLETRDLSNARPKVHALDSDISCTGPAWQQFVSGRESDITAVVFLVTLLI